MPIAVGPEAGTATLFIDEARRGLSSMEKLDGATPLQVPIATLLSVVERSGVSRVDALKIDIEGFEDRALLPFFSTAPRTLWPKRIYMETDWAARWERDCIACLLAAGYVEAWRGSGDILLALRQRDFQVACRQLCAGNRLSGDQWRWEAILLTPHAGDEPRNDLTDHRTGHADKRSKGLGITPGSESLSHLKHGGEQNVEVGNMDETVARHCGGHEQTADHVGEEVLLRS